MTVTTMMDVGSADVIRLIQSHLLEVGLRGSVRAIQEETGIKLPGQLSSSSAGEGGEGSGASNFFFHASSGNWGAILESLSWIDMGSAQDGGEREELVAEVYEMTILELAEAGDLALAYATYRLVQPLLEKSEVMVRSLGPYDEDGDDETLQANEARDGKKKDKKSKARDLPQHLAVSKMSRARLLEQKLAALAATARPDATTTAPKIPPDFYYCGDLAGRVISKKHNGSHRWKSHSPYPTRQERREDLGRRLQDAVPCIPRQRLTALLQQAVLWQSHTGQLPRVQRMWRDDASPESNDDHDEGDGNGQVDGRDKKEDGSASGKKRAKKRLRKEFDLVLGTVQVDAVPSGTTYLDRSKLPVEPVARRPYSVVKFGKQARPESAVFLPNGSGLVTGSSDGLIEVWEASSQYSDLMLSLEYQRNEQLMGHDSQASITALTVSNDGQILASGDAMGCIKVWKIKTGQCLRSWQAHGSSDSYPSASSSAIVCIAFAPDASRVLTASRGGDGSCREFGLRTTRMLMELSRSVTWCGYCVVDSLSAAATATTLLSPGRVTQQDPDDRDQRLLIVTASGDGAVRIWDRVSQEVLRVLRPVASVGVPESSWSRPGGSVAVSRGGDDASSPSAGGTRHDPTSAAVVGSPTVHTVLMLHTPPSTLIVVPRGPRAFLIDYAGTVVRVFDSSDKGLKNGGQGASFVAAAVSCTNQWLYAVTESGVCCIFNVDSGELEAAVRDFGEETMRLQKDSAGHAEVTNLVHHPNRSILAAFSNSRYQKKGQIVMWK
jgi:WD40 repeat-containing protein SMU1